MIINGTNTTKISYSIADNIFKNKELGVKPKLTKTASQSEIGVRITYKNGGKKGEYKFV